MTVNVAVRDRVERLLEEYDPPLVPGAVATAGTVEAVGTSSRGAGPSSFGCAPAQHPTQYMAEISRIQRDMDMEDAGLRNPSCADKIIRARTLAEGSTVGVSLRLINPVTEEFGCQTVYID